MVESAAYAQRREEAGLRKQDLDRDAAEARARAATLCDVIAASAAEVSDLQLVLKTLLGHSARLCNAQGGSIHLLDGESQRTVALFGVSAYEQHEVADGVPDKAGLETLIGRVAARRDVVHLPDVLSDPDHKPHGPTLLGAHRSIVGLPLMHDNTVTGVLFLSRENVQPFTTDDITLARVLAAQISLIVEKARLLDERRDALEQRNATSDVLRILSRSAFDQHAVFQTIVESARHLSDADNATLALFEGGRSHVAANAGQFVDEVAYNAAWADLPLHPDRSTITGRILMAKATVHLPDLDAEKGTLKRSVVPATGARSVLASPLLRDGEVVGTLVARRRRVGPFSARDVHLLETFADQAVIAIETTRLFTTVLRQYDQLSHFLSPQVAKLITSEEGARLLEGHRRQISVIFCDLRGFTAFSETAEPEEVLGVMRQYQATMGRMIVEQGGTLEHFAGDGMMVFFNDPVEVDDHERAAVRLAIAMQSAFAELAAAWRKRGYELGLGIGVATGYATLGRIGFEGRYDYGAIGIVVIMASRLSMEAKPGQILLTQRVQAALGEEQQTQLVGEVALKGVSRPVPAYEVQR